MKLLLWTPLISLVVSVRDPHTKKTDENGDLHVHLNVPDLGPVQHVHLNKLTRLRKTFKGRTGNRKWKENRAGCIFQYHLGLLRLNTS